MRWFAGHFSQEPRFIPTNEAASLLDVRFDHSDVLWPWSGFLAFYIRVAPEAASYTGVALGSISFAISSPPARGETAPRTSPVTMQMKIQIIATPPRYRLASWASPKPGVPSLGRRSLPSRGLSTLSMSSAM